MRQMSQYTQLGSLSTSTYDAPEENIDQSCWLFKDAAINEQKQG
jgi:phage baseplate assembly protein gpV